MAVPRGKLVEMIRAVRRIGQNMEDSLLDDGGAQERTQYNGSYLSTYTRFYRLLRDKGGAAPEIRKKLESLKQFDPSPRPKTGDNP